MLILLFSSLSAEERYAFIYSKNIDDRFINFYDKVVVEAEAVDNIYAIRYPKKMVAYVSVGEIEAWRKSQKPYQKSWVLSENKTWNSLIADLTQEGYRNFVLQRIQKLHKQGYRNFFLDTMDSYHVLSSNKKLFKKQQRAIVSFIHKIRQKYPNCKLIINRGFELLDQIHQDIDGVVAESLLNRYNHAKKSYTDVPKTDQEWLLENLKKAQNYNLDTVSIEYSDQSTKERHAIAKRVKALGVIPYVTDGLLQEQGECDIERVRRDVLILFNKSLFKDKNAAYSDVHLLTSMPLEYFGYVPILHDLSTQELPQRVEDRYHSVIVWSSGTTKNDKKLYAWAIKMQTKGIKILFLTNFVFTPSAEKLYAFGLKSEPNNNSFRDNTTTTYHQPYQTYEIPASIEYEESIITAKDAQPILSVSYKNGQTSMPIAITSWGGYALDNSFLLSIDNENYWSIDPFKFIKEALKLDNIPMPDPTTEAGRRILLVHVDGDGFVEPVRTDNKRLSTEYLIKHIYKKYPIPQTVSLIQGEVDTIGLFPKLSPKMKRISKELYAIPWIEPASHTLSHPFYWDKVTKPENATPSVGKNYHLALPNYHFSLKKETIGSIEFSLSFAPKTKQNEKILFWTGDCLPTKKVLAFIERQGILAMNGGDTTIKKSDPWLSHIAPFGLQREEYWQIYTGQQNENVFTNDWLGPFWGYRDVIDTFKMTESPRRLKPINIYYHFYSGSKVASLKALDEVYSWATKQKTSKLYASQYIRKARGFYRTAIAKTANGYEIRNSGYLRTVRFKGKVHVDIAQSQGVAGYTYHQGQTYITLDKREEHQIKLTTQPSHTPYLIDANGWVESFTHNNQNYTFKLQSNVTIKANFYLPSSCHHQLSKGIEAKKVKNSLSIFSHSQQGATIAFQCQ